MWAALPWASAQAAEFAVPTVQTPTLASAVALAQDGDRIVIDGALYKGEDPAVSIGENIEIQGINGHPRLPPLSVADAELKLSSVWLSGTRLLVAVPLEDLDTVVLGPEDYGSYPFALFADEAIIDGTDLVVSNAAGAGVYAVDAGVEIDGFEASGFESTTAFAFEGGSRVRLRNGSIEGAMFGAIGAADSEIEVDDVTFSGNSGLFGADVFATGTGQRVRLDGIVSTGASSSTDGGSIHVLGVELDLDDVRIEGASAGGCGGALYAEDADVAAVLLAFDGVQAITGGAVCLQGGQFDAAGVDVLDAAVFQDGGFLWATDAAVSIGGLVVGVSPGAVVATDGGVAWVGGGSLDLVGASVTGVAVFGDGGAIRASGADITLDGGTAEQIKADADGGFAWVDGGTLQWTGGTVRQCAASNGSVVQALGSAQIGLRDGLFIQNDATAAGTIRGSTGTAITVERSRFCANEAAAGSGLFLGGERLADVVTNTVFLGNEATDATAGSTIAVVGASLAGSGARVVVRNVDFVEEAAARAVVYSQDADVDVRNAIFFGDALAADADDPGPGVSGAFDLFHDPSGATANTGDAPGFGGSNTVLADPLFQGWSSGACDSNLWLEAGSPARDAGDPMFLDPDGSRSDMGAFGGPDADLVDADSDGVFEDLDCDDADPGAHSGSDEIPYDGIDQDCDGDDLVDVDGDGHDAIVAQGDDCDDEDPGAFPGADEVPYDGVDQDCDGADLVDVDGDGFAGWSADGPDCDDDDGDVNPDATESWYDGVDQDCDGNDDDRDLDGFAADHVGGTDCDDDDDTIHPGVAEIANDAVDQDCDGYMDRTRLTGSGGFGCGREAGCQTTPGSGAAAVLAALAALFRRRAGPRLR